MFYVKVPLSDGVTIQAEIRSDNVITHCHCCGTEMTVDLIDVLSDGSCDLEGTQLLCPECSSILLERVRET